MSNNLFGFSIDALDREVYLDGCPIADVASAFGSRDRLEYEDVMLYFGFNADEYTEAVHDEVLAKIFRSNESNILLWQDGISKYYKDSGRIGISEFEQLEGKLKAAGIPSNEIDFRNYIESIDKQNKEGIDRIGFEPFGHYLIYKYSLEFEDLFEISKLLKMLRALVRDVDQERAGEVKGILESNGCKGLEKYKDLIELYIQDPGRTDIIGDQNHQFNQYLVCCYEVMFKLFKQNADAIENGGMPSVRQGHKNITHTNYDRMLLLRTFMQMLSEVLSDEKPPVKNVLVIGPGLEEFHVMLRESIPRQSYEPYALIDSLLEFKWADLAKLQVDMLDVSPRVVKHFRRVIEGSYNGENHKLYCLPYGVASVKPVTEFGSGLGSVNFADGVKGARIESGENGERILTIHPKISQRMKIMEGNIITDHVADEGSYDLVVILNTFMYFSNEERLLALENITRLMAPGGILITDLPSEEVSASSLKSLMQPMSFLPLAAYIKSKDQ